MTVYADVLVAVNYLLNLLILVVAGKITGTVISRRRVCLAALVGALGSLVIFLPFYGFALQTAGKLLLAAGMTAAAFGFRPVKRLARNLLSVFTVSFLFAGAMAALEFFVSPAGVLFYNGVVYFNLSALQLVGWSVAAFLILTLTSRVFASRPASKTLYRLTIRTNGKTISLNGLSDTGNALREPFSGAPVIVCSRSLAEKMMADQPQERVRLIPCSTVAGNGVLTGFRPDEVEIAGDGKIVKTSDVYIAAGSWEIDGEYQAVLHPQLTTR